LPADRLQEAFVPELEAEMAALRSRAELAEGSAAKLEESLLVGGQGLDGRLAGWLRLDRSCTVDCGCA
jgi:hypothetical protein